MKYTAIYPNTQIVQTMLKALFHHIGKYTFRYCNIHRCKISTKFHQLTLYCSIFQFIFLLGDRSPPPASVPWVFWAVAPPPASAGSGWRRSSPRPAVSPCSCGTGRRNGSEWRTEPSLLDFNTSPSHLCCVSVQRALHVCVCHIP